MITPIPTLHRKQQNSFFGGLSLFLLFSNLIHRDLWCSKVTVVKQMKQAACFICFKQAACFKQICFHLFHLFQTSETNAT